MTKTAEQLVQTLNNNKSRNLAFFQRHFPDIAKNFATRAFIRSRLNIDPHTLSVDLVTQETALYGGNAEAYNKAEAQQFSEAFAPGSSNLPVRHSYAESFYYKGRFFHASIRAFLEDIEATKGTGSAYLFHQNLPNVVFFGSGFGWHIRELLKLRPINHAVLVEHDPDRFLASLYMTDWQAMVQPFVDDPNRSFAFSVGDTTDMAEAERLYQAFGSAWNGASLNFPLLPVQTVLYIHKGDAFYTKAANRFNDEIEPSLNTWGYYDDEINQLNHVLHNLQAGVPILKQLDLHGDDRLTLICGNGPSLTPYLELIKKNRDKIILISAGSTTYTLLINDIYPDFVVTLESDLQTYKALALLPKENAKSVPVIGAAQIHPETFDLFADGLVYFKHETTYAHLFGKPDEIIADGTPSATNAALAVALDLKLSNIYLVGMDFGFFSTEETHAKESFYYHQNERDRFENYRKSIDKKAYFLETNEHGKIYTTPFYNTGRKHAERKIRGSNRLDIVNLSTGASIEGTRFGDIDQFRIELTKRKVTDATPVFATLKKNARTVDTKELNLLQESVKKLISDITSQILKELKGLKPTLPAIEATLYRINRIVSRYRDGKEDTVALFIRGSIWHWCFNFYALIKSENRQDQMEFMTEKWLQHFGRFLKVLPEHYEYYLSDRSTDDPRLKLMIREPEPELDRWLTRKEEAESESK